MRLRSPHLTLSIGFLLLFLASGCDPQAGAGAVSAGETAAAYAGETAAPAGETAASFAGETAAPGGEASKPALPADSPLSAYQAHLLELAFESASAIPVDPHIKTRCREQVEVAAAALELDQPRRALRYIEQIGDWRRGEGYAEFALWCARHGATSDVQHYLDLANAIAEGAEDWRRDTIRVTIAQTHVWLGQDAQADVFEAGVVDSETGKVDGVRAGLMDESTFDEQVKVLDELVATGHFDLTRNALATYAQLFNRFYGDEGRRSLVEERIETSWSSMPILVRIDLLKELTRFALDHEDRDEALERVNETQLMLESAQWTAENLVPVRARLAALRHRAGDTERARIDADETLAIFDRHRDTIVDIYRAGTLRPLAEAYQSMGDTSAALAVYAKAVEEGVVNPNARPRAEDLCATCCSLAVHGVEPDAELWSRVRRIREELGDQS